jgi:hypothetical protein
MSTKTLAHALDDPEAFALRYYGALDAVADRLQAACAPEEGAVFQAAMEALSALHPDEAAGGCPVGVAHDAGNDWALAAFEDGIRFGVAAEAVRRSLLTPLPPAEER